MQKEAFLIYRTLLFKKTLSMASVMAAGTALMSVPAMLMVVVVTVHVRVIAELSAHIGPDGLVRRTGNAAKQLYSRICKRRLCTCADASAYERVHTVLPEEPGQCAVAAALCIHDLLGSNRAVFNVIELELLRVAKVLEYRTVFISYCNTHDILSFPNFRPLIKAGVFYIKRFSTRRI